MVAGLRADALADLELAYAPPFSSAKDPVNMLGYMAENVLSGELRRRGAREFGDDREMGWTSSMSGLQRSTPGDASPQHQLAARFAT